MAFDVGAVVAHIQADLSGFTQGIEQAKSQVSSLGERVGSVAGGIRDFANQAAVLSTVVAGGFTLIAKEALNSAASYEQSRIAFETMLGSADKAKKLLKELSDFAVATPFELPQLVEGSQRLLAFGLNADQIIPTMKTLGDIASGLGTDKLPQLIHAFGQVAAGETLSGRELNEFVMAGVPLIDALKKHFEGATVAVAASGAAHKGHKVDTEKLNAEISIQNERIKELSANHKTHASTMMAAKERLRELEGQLASGTVTTTGFTKATQLSTQQITEMISKHQVTFKDVQEALTGMTEKGGKFFDLMDKQSHTFNGVMSNVHDQLGRIMRNVMGITDSGDIINGSFFEKIKNVASVLLEFLNSATPMISNFFNKLSDIGERIFNALAPVGKWISDHHELVITFLKGLALGIAAILIVAPILAVVLNPFILLFAAIAGAVALLYTAWQTNFMGIREIVHSVVSFIVDFFTNYLMPVIVKIRDWWTEHWTFIATMLKGVWEIIKGVVQAAWAIVSGIIKVGIDLLTGNWKRAWDDIKNMLSGAWEGIKNIFNGALDFIKGWGGAILHDLTKPFEDAWHKIQDLVGKIKSALDFTQRHSPSVVDIVENGVRKVNEALGGLAFSGNFNVNPTPAFQGVGSGAPIANTNIHIDMSGAVIADQNSAMTIGEKMGDAIIRKLQLNIRV